MGVPSGPSASRSEAPESDGVSSITLGPSLRTNSLSLQGRTSKGGGGGNYSLLDDDSLIPGFLLTSEFSLTKVTLSVS